MVLTIVAYVGFMTEISVVFQQTNIGFYE